MNGDPGSGGPNGADADADARADEWDVLVVGAGPAGAATALALAGRCRVALLGRAVPPGGRLIGESLPAAAATPLRDLGVWDAFVAQGHRPAWSHVSAWGDAEPVVRDALFDPLGPGWHLDRAAFDALLREAALARGVPWMEGVVLRGARHEAGARHPWFCDVSDVSDAQQGGRRRALRCRLLVDASGRAARVVRLADVEVRREANRLVCLHAWLPPVGGGGGGADAPRWPGATLIEACAGGWWYSADLPDGGAVLAFHTDADAPTVRSCRSVGQLAALARQGTRLISARCAAVLDNGEAMTRAAAQPVGVAPAHSQWALQAAGTDWMAVGDAALAFDPLASQGLLNGLCTGLQAANLALAYLAGDVQALPIWARHVGGIRAAYARNLAAYYAMETRWPEATFWRRRSASFALA